ncbi:hypothetical protein BHE74_00007889 [Ensete ventricosum]|nr:hypothetical protein GW17_00022452 [Ensete ventricosum]RWW83592.1 hypothetical protein BHE74_00007889 [Ensete ventricosum]RZR84891.1 hypothetical protein BHM03_00011782 [Ensete ventricosum]
MPPIHNNADGLHLEKKDYGKGEREAQWAPAQRTLHGLQPPPHTSSLFDDNSNYRELSEIRDCKVKQHTPLYHYMLEFYTSREERCLFD